MRLSIVIVNWNSIDDLKECLQSLRSQSYPELEVIVVDNGSSDGSAGMVASEFAEYTLLQQTENLGFAEACNLGIEASTGSWVVMLNNDAVAQPNWATAMVEAIAVAPPECGMLQSLLLYRTRPNIINSTGIELSWSGGGRDRKEGQLCDLDGGKEWEEIFCPTAGAAAYRRSMLEAIRLPTGYFDRLHFMYFEDMDLGWRARLAGWSAFYIPTSVVFHNWHGSTRRRGRTWLLVLSSTNRLRTLLKNASISLILSTLPATLKEIAELIWFGRFKATLELIRAVSNCLAVRRRVSEIAQVKRRDLERTWRQPSR